MSVGLLPRYRPIASAALGGLGGHMLSATSRIPRRVGREGPRNCHKHAMTWTTPAGRRHTLPGKHPT
jgi:hypothetical protein